MDILENNECLSLGLYVCSWPGTVTGRNRLLRRMIGLSQLMHVRTVVIRRDDLVVEAQKSIKHAAEKLKITAEAKWLSTDSLLTSELEKKLEAFDGLWAGPGSPYKSLDGMLRGIEFARRRDWPFVGT